MRTFKEFLIEAKMKLTPSSNERRKERRLENWWAHIGGARTTRSLGGRHADHIAANAESDLEDGIERRSRKDYPKERTGRAAGYYSPDRKVKFNGQRELRRRRIAK